EDAQREDHAAAPARRRREPAARRHHHARRPGRRLRDQDSLRERTLLRGLMHAAVVAVAVANVWAVPGTATIPNDPHLWPTPAISYTQRRALVGHMPTQVLLGERVLVLARRGAWTKIAVPDQPSPLDRRGYPGWVLTSQLRSAKGGVTAVVTEPKARLANGMEGSLGAEVPPGASTSRLPATRADLVRTAKLF